MQSLRLNYWAILLFRSLVSCTVMDFSEYAEKENINEIKVSNKSFTRIDGKQLLLFENLENLEFSYSKLSELPAEIGGLTKLKDLNLDGNQLVSLPSELGKLAQLQALWLVGNQLTTLPQEIGGLTQLERLDLEKNQLTSLPPEIGALIKLQELWLNENRFSSLPPEIGKLFQLQKLNLSINQLILLPSEIGGLAQLQELWLNENRLTSLPPGIGDLIRLQQLVFDNNLLTTLPLEIGCLSRLQRLYVSGNQLTLLPSEIGGLNQLQELNLSGNLLTSLPGSILNLQNSIVILNLIGNPIVESGTDGNLGRQELEALFGDKVVFESARRPKNFKRISKEGAIGNSLAQPLHWNLEKLKKLINNRVPGSEYTEQQMLETWTGSFAQLITKENNELMVNYIKKLYSPDMEYKKWPMKSEFIPMAKDLLEAVFKECLKVDSKQDQSKKDKEATIRSNLSAICIGIKHCQTARFLSCASPMVS